MSFWFRSRFSFLHYSICSNPTQRFLLFFSNYFDLLWAWCWFEQFYLSMLTMITLTSPCEVLHSMNVSANVVISLRHALKVEPFRAEIQKLCEYNIRVKTSSPAQSLQRLYCWSGSDKQITTALHWNTDVRTEASLLHVMWKLALNWIFK